MNNTLTEQDIDLMAKRELQNKIKELKVRKKELGPKIWLLENEMSDIKKKLNNLYRQVPELK